MNLELPRNLDYRTSAKMEISTSNPQKLKVEEVEQEEDKNPPTPPSSPLFALQSTPEEKQLLEDQDTRPLPNYIRRWNNSLDKEFSRVKALSRAQLRPKITTWESIKARKAGVTDFPHTYWDGIVQVKKDWIEYRTGSMEDGLYEWCDGLLVRVFKGWTLYWDFP